ncbi:MAG: hypothetical protein GYA16_15615 [Spirochaetes bacterium]|nr:hypothetical protein [Spirochaetota bacterium]
MKRLIDLTKTSQGIVLYHESGMAIYHKWNNIEGVPKYVDKKIEIIPEEFTAKPTGFVIIYCHDFVKKYATFHININFDKLKGKSAVSYPITNKKNELIYIICPF